MKQKNVAIFQMYRNRRANLNPPVKKYIVPSTTQIKACEEEELVKSLQIENMLKTLIGKEELSRVKTCQLNPTFKGFCPLI